MAIKTLRVFQEFTSEGYVPMPPAGNIDYGYTIAGTFPGTTPATFQTDDPDIDVNVTTMTDFYVWIRSHGAEWNINYTRNVRVYPDSPSINNVVMGIIIANFENALPSGGTTGQILAKIDNTDYNAEWIDNYADWTSQLKHEVKASVALTKGQAVYVSSADGTNMIVSKASNASESTSSKTLGLIAQNLSVNSKGFVITEGLLSGLNTSSATVGDAVWLGTDGNLIYGLANKPVAPAHLVFIGIVTRVNNSNGEIFVKVQNGFELREIHDVLITSPTNNQGLLYDSASTLWKNADVQLPISLTNTGSSGASTFIGNVLNIPNYTLVGLGGVPTTRTITINGTTYDLSADRTWTISSGTVTSVAATVPTGFAISGSPITTSGTLAIAFAAGYSLPTDAKQAQWDTAYNNRIVTASMPLQVDLNNISIYQSSPTSNGYLSSTDWTTFNNKQNALNGSGFVKASGTTITYDNSTYVPTSRTLTINGVTFDLSANRSWTVGSELTASAPLSITSGVISISQATNTTNGFLSSTDWATFNAKQSALSGSGFVKVSGTTVSYDNTAYTPTSRLLTINGISYDLSADRAWTITPGSGMRNIQTFTATSGQTTFTITGGYTVGLVDVFVNGTRLSTSDFTATNGTTVVLGVGVVANDIVDVINYTASLTSGITGSGTTNYIPKWSGSSAITNSLIFDNGTNVGIGTASPDTYSQFGTGAGLTLQTSVTNGSSNINVVGNGTGFGGINFGNGTIRRAGIYGLDGSVLGFYTNSTNSGAGLTERMRIASNGRVGINNSSPSYAMHITGTSGTGARLLQVDGTGTAFNIISVVNDGCQLFLSAEGNTGGNIATGSLAYAGIIDTNTNTSLQFATWATVRMTILNSGNVGIGTTNPNAKLHIENNGTTSYSNQIFSNSSSTASLALGVGGSSVGASFAQNNAYLINLGNSALVFGTNDTERMRITSAGNVGIGTTSPSSILELAQPQYTFLTLTGTNATQVQMNLGVNQVTQGAYVSSVSNHPLILQTNSTERMRITSGGRVLIATTSLQDSYLNIDGGAAVTCISTFQNGSGSLYHYAVRNSNGYVGGISSLGSMTLFNTTSDYRLKEDFKSFNGLDKINKINVYDFKWKNSEERMDGVIAHELQEIIPYAVSGKKDGKYMQGVDYSKIVPVLVQAIKELNAKLEAK